MEKVLKLTSLFLVLILMFVLSSCGNKNDIDIDNELTDVSTPAFIYNASWFGRLMKYDVIEKRASYACPDPLCEHGEDCLFNLVESLYIAEDLVFYVRNFSALYLYDPSSPTAELVYETNGDVYISGYADGELYFSASEYIFDENTGILSSENWHLYKYARDNKTVTKLSTEPLADSLQLKLKTEDKLVWRDRAADMMFETDFEFKNRNETEYSSDYMVINNKQNIDGYSYYFTAYADFDNNNVIRNHIMKVNLETSERDFVVEGALSAKYLPEHDAIIYIPFTGKHIIEESESGEKTVTYVGEELWIKKRDGSSEYKICDLPDDLIINNVISSVGNDLSSGDYAAMHFKDTEGIYEPSSAAIFIVNIKTGENFILSIK